jgi:hypothetical protein
MEVGAHTGFVYDRTGLYYEFDRLSIIKIDDQEDLILILTFRARFQIAGEGVTNLSSH